MTISAFKLLPLLLAGSACFGQTFQVTGTAIPQSLVRMNYGKIPNGISAWDLSICNVTNAKQSVVSSAIYQALASSNNGLQPIGRQIMLAPILRNQN
ncbi:MAG: hypothetical protein JO319_13800, partial [Acidobacteriaceae bacterium]|nr:hypothetical protein [Acidobacteriaceae bacterium]